MPLLRSRLSRREALCRRTLGKKLRFVFRNFPLTQAHPYALIAAEAAEAAALQDKFWEMHDLLFEQQTFLEPDIIPSWAKRIGLNLEKFENDIKQGVVEKRIKEDRQSGIRSGVNGTPTFFINGTRYDGSPDYAFAAGGLRVLGATLRLNTLAAKGESRCRTSARRRIGRRCFRPRSSNAPFRKFIRGRRMASARLSRTRLTQLCLRS